MKFEVLKVKLPDLTGKRKVSKLLILESAKKYACEVKEKYGKLMKLKLTEEKRNRLLRNKLKLLKRNL